ncbi:S-layer homology domain-containing protein [Paenibacillus apiarius]|uniref:S-layer homology domain-containing protein n=1 Tax=Paenibacillus apiarius TaxID=46240 RepID=A0ABT4DSM9_9BACL|nr:S-layer homology domain-containing protein [Paenibacillus apiarius]MCY9514237.1 S-layer homology domain-containing protein [Paenibacillus apiarius]MCY9520360.1 S-layer homology domain-containing protein [Paenibacillus apiarius]MCY9554743.1 S-layer homology domain-containing protein [Paenibacillus apiarius]MCY9557360.1 S-layer homology domain-containing protein [Paenibacillus apiarius]MCY9682461.1 S-layer homology domain-containing protein [Paenibacillus apiarius]
MDAYSTNGRRKLKRQASLLVCLFVFVLALNGCQAPQPRPHSESLTDKGQAPRRIHVNEAADASVPERLQSLRAAAWPQLNNIWPHVPWSDVALLYADGQQVYAVEAKSVRLLAGNDHQAALPLPDYGQVSVRTWQGTHAVIVRKPDSRLQGPSAEAEEERAFRLATEQLVLTLGFPREGTRRATQYPLSDKPRQYRLALIDRLTSAVLDETYRKNRLQEAKYWWDTYQQNAADDSRARVNEELREGAASYVSNYARYAAAHPDASDVASWRRSLRAEAAQWKPSDLASLVDESRAVTLWTALLADEAGIDWREAAYNGTEPARTLLSSQSAEWQSLPAEIAGAAKEMTKRLNQTVSDSMSLYISGYEDAKKPLLALPAGGTRNGARWNGFYKSSDIPGTVLHEVTGSVDVLSGSVQLRNKTVAVQPNRFQAQLKDEEAILVIPLWENDYIWDGQTLQLTEPLLQGKVNAVSQFDMYGRRYFTADVASPALPGGGIGPYTPPVASHEPLRDIRGHWAESTIAQLVADHTVSGYEDSTFRPNRRVTRAEFAQMIVGAYKLKPRAGRVYPDTAKHWAKDAIATAQSYGIVQGYDENTYGPNDWITREQMAVMLVKASHLPKRSLAQPYKRFTDTYLLSGWAEQDVYTAIAHGILGGYEDRKLKPLHRATRAEAAVMLHNALQLKT